MNRTLIFLGMVAPIVVAAASTFVAVAWGLQPTASTPVNIEEPKKPTFPHSWAGQWQGDAQIQLPGGGTQDFTMGLHIKKDDTDPARWSWTVIYDGASGKQERKYELVEKNASKGLWEIDERNSIILPAQMLGDALWSCFEVQGTTIHVSYRPVFAPSARGEVVGINVEMTSFQAANGVKTGGGTVGEGESKQTVPTVTGYRFGSLQTAKMVRIPVKHQDK